MGGQQVFEPALRKVGIWPALVAAEVFWIQPVPLKLQSSQSPADVSVVDPEDVAGAMAEVVVPSLDGLVDSLDDGLQGLPRSPWREIAQAIYELAVAFLSGESKGPPKRIAQKRETFLPRVDDLRLRRMERQPVLFYPCAHNCKSCYSLLVSAAQNDKVICVAHHLAAILAHEVVQRIEIGVGQDR